MKHFLIVKSMLLVSGLAIMSKFLGFIKQMILASIYGTTLETDLISLSQGMIGNIEYVIVQVLITAFISTYIYIKEKNEDKAMLFSVEVGEVFTLFVTGIVIFIFIGAPFLAGMLAPGYSFEARKILSNYLSFLSPMLICFVWIAVFQALLNANQKFIPGECIGLNQSIILVGVVWIFKDRFAVGAINIAFVIYTLFNVIFLGCISRKYWKLSRSNPFSNPEIKKLLSMTVPLFVGYSMIYVNQQVDKVLVSGMLEGTVSALGYAAVLSNLVGTFIVTLCSVMFSYITGFIVSGEERKVARVVETFLVLFIIILLPVSIITILCAEDIVSLVFERGAFDSYSVKIAASALAGYGFSFIPLTIREMFSKIQYGYQDTKQPMINSAISIAINIILSIILSMHGGVFGITIASSVATLICGILNAYSVKKRNLNIEFSFCLRQLPLLVLGGGVCFRIAKWAVSCSDNMNLLARFCFITISTMVSFMIIISPVLYRILKKYKEVSN